MQEREFFAQTHVLRLSGGHRFERAAEILGKPSRHAEQREEPRETEPRDLRNAASAEREERDRGRFVGGVPCHGPSVNSDSGLPVCAERHETVLVRLRCHHAREESPDRLAALEPLRSRRHREARVLGEQRGECVETRRDEIARVADDWN
jgi:hypothetical protein